jgi:hypothetical protein
MNSTVAELLALKRSKKPQRLVRVTAETKRLLDVLKKQTGCSIPQLLHVAIKLIATKAKEA